MFFLLSCNENMTKKSNDIDTSLLENNKFVAINIADVNKEIKIPLSELLQNLEFIALENKEEAIIKAWYADVSDNYIGIAPFNNEAYKLFDRKGNYICPVGNIGQGPGEYILFYSSQLDETSKRIYLSSFDAKKIQTYDLKGNFLESECILLPSILPKHQAIVNNKEKKVTIVALPFKGEGPENICWVQNFKGEILQSVPADNYAVMPTYDNEILSYHNMPTFDFQLSMFYQQKQDTLYHYDVVANKIEPVLTLNAPVEAGKVIYNYLELPRCFIISINYIEMNMKPDNDIGKTKLIIVDKKTLKSNYIQVVNDFLGGIKIDPHYLFFCIRNGYFASIQEPAELKEQLKDALDNNNMKDDVRKRVVKLYQSLNENDNNIVMIGKVKQ